MKPIRADFVQLAGPRPFVWAGGAALVISSIAAAVLTVREWDETRLRSEELQIATERRDVQPPPSLPTEPRPYDTNARHLIGTRSFPWTEALTMLESTAVVGVVVTQVDFAAGESSIRAEVASSDYAGVLAYLETLDKGEPIVRWSLSQTQGQGQTGSASSATTILLGRVLPR